VQFATPALLGEIELPFRQRMAENDGTNSSTQHLVRAGGEQNFAI
jgi:hypothetical protein